MNDAAQGKLRVTLNLIHAMSKALATSTQLDGNLAQDTCFYCSEMILRAAMELHQDVSAAISHGESGMENAKAKGKKIGRPPLKKDDIPTNFLRHYPAFVVGQLNISELALVCGLSRPTVYKHLKLL